MKKNLFTFIIFGILMCLLCLGASADDAITIDSMSFDLAETSDEEDTGSVTFTIPEVLEGKSVTLVVRATNPLDNTDEGIAYINQYDNVTAGQTTVDFIVRDTIDYGILTFYVGATDLETPISDTKLYGLLGDASKDGIVDILDASILLKYAVKLANLDASAIVLGNVNSDLGVDITDASLVLKYSVKLPTDYPIGQ